MVIFVVRLSVLTAVIIGFLCVVVFVFNEATMACNNPYRCFYSNVVNPETGKRSLVFKPSLRYLGDDPLLNSPLDIPCTKCLGCKADESLMWSIRCYHESMMHEQNSFITLTYDDEHLPHDRKIDKRELQLFFKRLRKSLSRNSESIRYFACGEYGELSSRPHYHGIIFGKDWLEGAVDLDGTLYTHESLSSAWGKGLVSIAPVSMASICYVCGYVNKKVADPDTFRLMSRGRGLVRGIGHSWLDAFHDDIKRTGVVTIEGRSYAVPKRYMIWNEEEFAELKLDRALYAKERSDSKTVVQHRADRRARELHARAKLKANKLKGKI